MNATKQGSGGQLRIGQLAVLAATTSRAIRHYHAIGLLPEPERDQSGYRRYGAEHLVRLIRIRRLRSLEMPLEQITTHLAGNSGEPGDLAAALRSLAADLSREIEKLQEIRARALELAASTHLADPIDIWQTALRRHTLLGETAAVPAREREAVELLDALHPHGIDGVIEQASELLSEPDRTAELGALLERFRGLTDESGQIDDLAAAIAAAVPRPHSTSPVIDVEAMESLIGGRFTAAQRQCMRRMRGLLEAGAKPTRQ
ncbi:MAG: MerR family transcriptional regulator [Solirubrobacteraceae bacterium]